MNKTLIVVAVPLLSLAACGPDVEENEDGTTIAGDDYELTFDDVEGETSMVITGPDGEATFETGSGVDPNLPDGWSVYPGADIQTAINIDGAGSSGEAGTMVVMQVDADIDDVIEHYRSEAESSGHEIKMELTTGEAKIIGGEGPDNSNFSVSVVPGEEGSPVTVQLTVGRNE